MNAHPFYSSTYSGQAAYTVDAPSRLLRVQRFTLEQCQAALELDGLQKTVRTAIERRMRKLQRESAQ